MGNALMRGPLDQCLSVCKGIDNSECFSVCLDDSERRVTGGGGGSSTEPLRMGGRRRLKPGGPPRPSAEQAAKRLEELTRELFRVHDLNGNGLLEEAELVSLNERIALLHSGPDLDLSAVRHKYQELFRTKLDPNGRAVPYMTFRTYAREVLDGLDPDPEAQELILEQFVAEAVSACQALPLTARRGEAEESNDGSPTSPIDDLIDLDQSVIDELRAPLPHGRPNRPPMARPKSTVPRSAAPAHAEQAGANGASRGGSGGGSRGGSKDEDVDSTVALGPAGGDGSLNPPSVRGASGI